MRLLRAFAPVVCALAVLVTRPAPFADLGAAAEGALHRSLGTDNIICRLYLDPHDRPGGVHAPIRSRQSLEPGAEAPAVLSNIQVSYAGFTAPAQTAFQFAVDVWASQVQSSVPIVVNAEFENFGDPLLLGQAGATCAFANFPNAPRPNTWFPVPIASRLAGTDLLPSPLGACTDPADISAAFNSTANWYYGTDGAVPSGKVDFVSVVLHELGHGLGFFGSGTISSMTGDGSVGSGGRPYIYDVSVVDHPTAGNSLITYPSPSTQLATALRSNNLYWDGTNGKSANSGTRPKLYAPASFENGSSYSHLDETTYPGAGINSLMTPSISQMQFVHTPGPIVLGMFADMGWNASAGCTYTLSAGTIAVAAAGGAVNVTLTTNPGCNWTAASNAVFITVQPADATGTGTKVFTLTVAANSGVSLRTGTISIGGQTLQINQSGTGPAMTIDKSSLIFTAVSNGAAFTSQTPAQTVRLLQSGSGTVTWNAASNAPWLVVSPTSGSGTATLTISTKFASNLAASQTGQITLTFTGAGSAAGPIAVRLNTLIASAAVAPTGSFDTPGNGATGVTGSIPVTGWAIDDVSVIRVRIMRSPLAGEGASDIVAGVPLLFIGNAVLVEGARPDVAALFPNHPQNTRAGWGYLMLTNFLPNLGNGTFTLYAVIDDADGRSTLLGPRTITCTNASATAPFGAIDTPQQGETVSGNILNFGWVLGPAPRRADPPGGGTVRVVIDGALIATVPGDWGARPDLSALFPALQFPGIATALGVAPINTATLANGVHTISWLVTDNTGAAAGIGSRYFTVSNGSLVLDPQTTAVTGSPIVDTPAFLQLPRAAVQRGTTPASLAAEIAAASIDHRPVSGRRGYDESAPLGRYAVKNGATVVQSEELDRIELRLGAGQPLTGYLRSGGRLAPLPIGSALDSDSGVFTWQPGVGFSGSYDLAFVRWAGGRAVSRHDVRVVLNAKASNRVGPQVVIDLPAKSGGDVSSSFVVAGWAADLDAAIGSGVDTVHVWAYPASGAAPIFVGEAAIGGARSDVAAIFGERFGKSGYGIEVEGLPAGVYDIAVFAYSTVSDGFVPAKTVRVRVR